MSEWMSEWMSALAYMITFNSFGFVFLARRKHEIRCLWNFNYLLITLYFVNQIIINKITYIIIIIMLYSYMQLFFERFLLKKKEKKRKR